MQSDHYFYFIYTACILGIGIGVIFMEIRQPRYTKINLVESWKAPWTELGVFIWIFFCIVSFSSSLADLLFPRIIPNYAHSIWSHLVPGFLMQTLLFCFTILSCIFFPHSFGNKINTQRLGLKRILKYGLYGFFLGVSLATIAGFFWSGIFSILEKYASVNQPQPQEIVNLFSHTDSPFAIPVIIFFAIFIAPVAEELVFRAGFYRFFKTHLPVSVATILTALAFACVHNSASAFLPLVLLGILLNRTYEITGNIYASILLHACFNMNTLTSLLLNAPFS